jgi:hypothetical protein
MGITNGPVVYGLDNFVLQSLDPAEEAEATEGGDCLVFRGLAFERYRLSEALAATGEKKIRKYSLLNWRSPPEARNTFKLDRLPSSATVARARSIILVDMPAGPDGILPDFLLRQMADRVRAGGRLIVLGGLLTLEKGNYQGTPLEPVLPVELSADVWRLRPRPEPVPLQPQSEELAAGLAWEPAPCVLYRHDLPLREGTEVLLKAGDQPLLVKRSYGEGEVFVFLGAPCGTAARALRFWEWPHWPTFLARVIAPGGQE